MQNHGNEQASTFWQTRYKARPASSAPIPEIPARWRPSTFTDRVIGSRQRHVHRLKVKGPEGEWAYYFLYVPPLRERAFRSARRELAAGSVAPEAYGIVLASDLGERPAPATLKYLKDKYGLNF